MKEDQQQIYEYLDEYFNRDADKEDKQGFILMSFPLYKEGVIPVVSNLGKQGVYIALKNMIKDFPEGESIEESNQQI